MTLLDMLGNANFQWVASGTFLLGASSGALGSFTLLRRRSLMADVLSHTALPGVAVAFMITQAKGVEALLLGAVIAGLIGTWCVDAVTRWTRVKEDSAQALVLSVFFGFGIVLLTRIASSGAAGQSGLDRFLFGQAASLIGRDIQVIGAVAFLLTVAVALFFKEFKLLCFDPGFGRGVGYPMDWIDKGLMLLVVCAVAVGLQAVGVVLMAAMLITPAAAARYWTDRLEVMVVLAALFGGLAGLAGTLTSMMGARLATGPLIVLAASGFFLLSAGFGSKRGLVPRVWRQARLRQKVAFENALRFLYETGEVRGKLRSKREGSLRQHAATLCDFEVAERLGWSEAQTRRLLRRMARAGLLDVAPPAFVSDPANRPTASGKGLSCRLTASGIARAEQIVRKHRLWEMFLAHEADFAVDHVDRDADDIEHFLPPDVVQELERRVREKYGGAGFPESVHPLDEVP